MESTVYLIVFIVCVVLLVVLVACSVYFCRKGGSEGKGKGSEKEAQSERQLVDEDLLGSDAGKTVKVASSQKCIYCGLARPNRMNIELLCSSCEKIPKRGQAHLIRQEVHSRVYRRSQNLEAMTEEDNFNPPPSKIRENPNTIVKPKQSQKEMKLSPARKPNRS
jgi:hypothetical protein